MNLLKDKTILIMGASNNRSIGWAIAEEIAKFEGNTILTYHPVMKERVLELGNKINSKFSLECDVMSDDSIKNCISEIEQKVGKIDGIVHSIAFSNKDNLAGQYCTLSRDDFNLAMNASVFSFTAIMNLAQSILNENASAITMTYYGAEKVIPNYNIMGVAKAALECSVRYLAKDFGEKNIRVNSISSGPIRTLAASGIKDFRSVLDFVESNSPLKRNVSLSDVAKTAIYLLSELSSGVTGENLYVDCGFNTIGMPLNVEK